MKPFKTLKGAGALALALFLFTSCSKNMDESSPKGDNEVAQLTGGPPTTVCAPFIGLQVRNNAGGSYFYVNDRLTAVNQQNFDGTDFSDKWLMEVTATGGTAYENDDAEAIGVKSSGEVGVDEHMINPTETLILKLGSSYLGQYLLRGADLQLHGVDGTNGTIRYYRAGALVDIEIINSLTFKNFGNSKFFKDPFDLSASKYFDEIRLTCSTGRYQLRGRTNTTGLPLLAATRFYFINVRNQVLLIGGGNAADNYVGRIINAAPDFVNKQTFTGTTEAGGWAFSGAPNRWLKFTPGASTSLFYSLSTKRFGISSGGGPAEGRSISAGETITIEKGLDIVGFDKFAGVEIRTTYATNVVTKNALEVKLYNGVDLVGTYYTTVPASAPFVSTTVIFPDGGLQFDKVVVTGTGAGASIGGGSGPYIRFYPACN